MGTRERPIDRGRANATAHIHAIGRELREARIDRGLSLREVAGILGCSHSKAWRVERARSPDVTVRTLDEFAAVVGLDLSMRMYPGGQPARDSGHGRLLGSFRVRLHTGLGWFTEAVFPNPAISERGMRS